MPSIPCPKCANETDQQATRCPHCQANLLVVLCPACGEFTPRDEADCTNCRRALAAEYRNLTDTETRELYVAEFMIVANQMTNAVAPEQRENFVRMYRQQKARLLKQISEEDYEEEMLDFGRRIATARPSTPRRTGCLLLALALPSALALSVAVIA